MQESIYFSEVIKKMKEIRCGVNKHSFFLHLGWLLLSTIVFHTPRINAVANKDSDQTKLYVVYMGERKHNEVEQVTESHHEMLASVLGSKEAAADSMIYSYRHGFSGFAAKMTPAQAKRCQDLDGVVQVFQNRIYKAQTTRSWDFLGLSSSSTNNLLHDTNQGDGVIIGVIDSGVWPEAESFHDKGLGPIPSKWKGFCDSGDQFNPKKHCNKKLIGARYFIKGFLAALDEPFNATQHNDYISPRDSNSHGTHCASTAAGAFVTNVSIDGLAHGTARGGAPRARLAVYKVLWQDKATSVDVLKAYDEAIHDGVDILSLSLGSALPQPPEVEKSDSIDYGAFHAVASGITVVSAGGNSGPKYETVANVGPWVLNVAAATLDRSLLTPIILGNKQIFGGPGMFVGKDTGFVDLTASPLPCESITSNETWAVGKIVVCFTVEGGEVAIIQAAINLKVGGGLGLIGTQKTIISLSSYHSDFPVVLVTYEVATEILKYIYFNDDPKIRVKPTKTYIGKDFTTYVASFSSRGPNSLSPSILKPDLAAPGVDILAAVPPSDKSPNGYELESGTSMACPHVAGIAALLKSLHPNWSPAAIKSALVTTAWTTDPYTGEPIYAQSDIPKIADPFDYGSGLVNPNVARNPGLVYDMGMQDYINYLCAMDYPKDSISELIRQVKSCPKSGNSILNLNLPSITIPNLKDKVTVTRTVTNVGDPNSKYEVVIDPPKGIVVKVNPTYLLFNPKIKKMSFNVTITTFHKVTTEYYFGSLTWTDRIHNVRIPISVRTLFPIKLF